MGPCVDSSNALTIQATYSANRPAEALPVPILGILLQNIYGMPTLCSKFVCLQRP
jgi:hypothetical protein